MPSSFDPACPVQTGRQARGGVPNTGRFSNSRVRGGGQADEPCASNKGGTP
jgi:hypothetical protein